jgi:hypothetical protein
MLDWCSSDFILIALAVAGTFALGAFVVSKIIKW